VRPQSITVERIIAGIARRAHGVVTREELLAAGVSRGEIKSRLRSGTLIRVFPGVYRAGHAAPSVLAWYAAAVKACGEGAVLSGTAAAHLHGLIKGPAPAPEVTTRTVRQVRGIRTRRARHVAATAFRGIPITSVPQTLVHLAGELALDDLARACHEAGVRHGTTPRMVQGAMRGRPKGSANLRAVMTGDIPVTLSQLEKRFLQLLEADNLPLPITNRVASERRVDCRWPEHHLTVELDSYRFHNSRHAFEQDRRREREAYARGDQHRRYTYGDVYEHPAQMLAELRTLLR
jgi:Transcriptional regulator, AbiEi antitoxin